MHSESTRFLDGQQEVVEAAFSLVEIEQCAVGRLIAQGTIAAS
jgi:hypothetical protein